MNNVFKGGSFSAWNLESAFSAPRLSFTGALDNYTTGLVGAWSSARRLLTSYAGSALRVRESGGSTEADVGFQSNGELDTTALIAHTGASDGLIRYLYDQSGGVRDFGKSTASAQPLIVSAGSVYTNINSKPTIKFDGADDALTATITAAAARTVYLVGLLRSSPGASKAILDFDASSIFAVLYANDGSNLRYYSTAAGGIESTTATITSKNILAINYTSASAAVLRVNGVSGASFDPNNIYSTSTSWTLGNDESGLAADLDVVEILAYNTSHDEATMDAIEAILASYYGITL